jgi:hypothetical protein
MSDKIGHMKPTFSLQSIFNPFVKSFGGDLVGTLIDSKNPPPNADYLLKSHSAILELKALEQQSFGEAHKQKVGALMADWQQRRLLRVYGTQRIDLKMLPPECQNEWLDVLGKPLQDNILAKANQQIRKTRELLNLPDFKGVLLIASDGNEDLQPDLIWFLVKRILQKKHPDGSPQYSNIDGVAYFNPRMPVWVPAVQRNAIFWIGPRNPEDHEMVSLLQTMASAWHRYFGSLRGETFPKIDFQSMPLEGLTFGGQPPKLPHIIVGEETQKVRPK